MRGRTEGIRVHPFHQYVTISMPEMPEMPEKCSQCIATYRLFNICIYIPVYINYHVSSTKYLVLNRVHMTKEAFQPSAHIVT